MSLSPRKSSRNFLTASGARAEVGSPSSRRSPRSNVTGRAQNKLPPRMMSFFGAAPETADAEGWTRVRRVIDDERSAIGISSQKPDTSSEASQPYAARTEIRSPPLADPVISQYLSDPDCPFKPPLGAQPTTTAGKAAEQLKDRRKVTLALVHEALKDPVYRPPPMFALFGSLERSTYFQELLQLSRMPGTAQFLEACDEQLRTMFPCVTLLDWLNNEETAPPESFFTMPSIAWPLQTIKKLTCYFATASRTGFEELVSLLQQGGVLCSGKGIFAALAVTCSSSIDEFLKNSHLMIRFSIETGLIYQEYADKFEKSLASCSHKFFALLVVNISIPCLQQLMAHHNACPIEGHIGTTLEDDEMKKSMPERAVALSEVQITKVVSQRAAVVTGHPVDLIRFEQLLIAFGEATGVKIHRDYLPAYAPENSPFFNQSMKMELLHSWVREQLVTPLSFKIPLFSPVDGREWSTERFLTPTLLTEIAAAVTCVPQDLTCSLQFLRPTDVLLEFDTSALRIGQLISWTKRSILIVAQPSDSVVGSALPSPRRSSQRRIRAATFAKCAIFNNVLQQTRWLGKPRSLGFGELTAMDCSFFDLGLLLDADMITGMSNVHFGDQSMTSMPSDSEGSPIRPPPARTNPIAAGSFFSSLSQFPSSAATGCHLTGFPSGCQPVFRAGASSSSSTSGGGSSVQTQQSFVAAVDAGANPFVAIPCTLSNAVNVYQLAPLIRYLEVQHRATLTQGAVEVVKQLSRASGIDFPAHAMLMCPTVFALFEYWDTLEFLGKRVAMLHDRFDDAESSQSSATSRGEPMSRMEMDRAVAQLAISRAGQRSRRLNQAFATLYESQQGIVQHNQSLTTPNAASSTTVLNRAPMSSHSMTSPTYNPEPAVQFSPVGSIRR